MTTVSTVSRDWGGRLHPTDVLYAHEHEVLAFSFRMMVGPWAEMGGGR